MIHFSCPIFLGEWGGDSHISFQKWGRYKAKAFPISLSIKVNACIMKGKIFKYCYSGKILVIKAFLFEKKSFKSFTLALIRLWLIFHLVEINIGQIVQRLEDFYDTYTITELVSINKSEPLVFPWDFGWSTPHLHSHVKTSVYITEILFSPYIWNLSLAHENGLEISTLHWPL